MAKKIIIYNVNKYYGGPLVLSALCKTFRDLGYDARLLFNLGFNLEPGKEVEFKKKTRAYLMKQSLVYYVHKFFKNIHFKDMFLIEKTPVSAMPGIKIQRNPFWGKKNTIVIYPEYLYGNPLQVKNVVRWLLYFNRFKDVEGAYDKKDMVICYRDIFNDPELNPTGVKLSIGYFDSQLYRRYNYGPRSGKCYILRKGKVRNDLPEHFDGPVYDDDMTQEELVKMFNEHEYCYSYDTQTFYTAIAAICGCKSIVVMEPGKTEKDYIGEGEAHYGRAYGDTPEQLEYAEKTKELLKKSLDYKERNEANVKAFIPVLEEKFGKIKRI